MKRERNAFLWLGETFFISGVALLIVRANSYPWPVKRSSDILFFLASASAILFLLKNNSWREFFRENRKVVFALVAIVAGTIIASLNHYLQNGVGISGEGVLELMRIVEVGILVLLVSLFSAEDVLFVKKFALAQLSTATYVVTFFLPSSLQIPMYRFTLFENWPSNVSYYLLVTLSFIVVWILGDTRAKDTPKTFLFALGVMIFGIFLWAQSRASWLAFAVGALIILVGSIQGRSDIITRLKNFLLGGAVFTSFLLVGFLILPEHAKNEVILRITPSLREKLTNSQENKESVQSPIEKQQLIDFREPSRPILWGVYVQMIMKEPLGLGLNYEAITYEGTKRGPHNTILEILVLGGPLALAGVLYLFWLSFKNLARKIRYSSDTRWPLYLISSLLMLVIASFFDNMSTFRLMWIILGLGIYFGETPTQFRGAVQEARAGQ